MIFASDNWAGAHPKVTASIAMHSGGFVSAYGSSDLDRQVTKKFSEIFEREVAVFFVGTGTAANSLALTLANKPGGVGFCHTEAHALEDECGAQEYLAGGARLRPVGGALGRIDPEKLEQVMTRFAGDPLHAGRPIAVSITQATEVGTVYGLDDIGAIARVAGKRGLPLHMDGARFANALVALETTPAEMTWKRGVDILSFGGTKNGCWCAEAIVLFDTAKASEMAFIHKRAAQLFSKSRFIAAQFAAYFEDGLWLETARHANSLAARLAGHIRASKRIRLAWEPQANEVFAIASTAERERLTKKGVAFHTWHTPQGFEAEIGDGDKICRFVTSFATTADDVDAFGELIG
ncbi:low specificity L-threonine aldolase [Mesorhizobium sp. BAC0120]|uniref:threonine aldolase family protein n=1 Tax=Mesorhizobium sp. BAC0120 TaxID=3090670 RepID=UPI00298D4711|nr:low specificity L-threonine aldolase [Mesorhizobium sp. BAC0120]MDW6025042.1 low specificity L-threonine aldolase [Mesorhizobium sp. BAC0120]